MSRDFRNLTVDNKLTTNILKANEVKMAYDRTDNILSNYSEITNLLTDNAQFQNFSADNASITNLDIVNLTVTNLSITNLTITGTTTANTISTTNLTYTNGVINNVLYLPNVNNSVDLSFRNSINTGIYKSTNNRLALASNGTSNGTLEIRSDVIVPSRVLLNVDGNETLPSYSFENKTDTGFFRPSDNQLGFTINGDEKMRITDNGIIMDTINSSTRINAVNGTNQSASFSFNNFQSTGIFRGTNLGEIAFTTSNTLTNMYFNNLSTTVYDPIIQQLDNVNISSTLNGGYALAKDVKPIISPYLASNTISNWNYSEYLQNVNASLTCITYSGPLNRVVTLGSNGLGAYSDDGGINFINTTMSGQTVNMRFSSIVWSDIQNEYVAVSIDNIVSTNNNLAYSVNGITWTAGNSINFRGNRVIYSKELNIFVAVGNDISTVNKSVWSNDGINWTAGTGIPVSGSLLSTNFRALAYSPEIQRFVTIGRNSADNATYIYYSTDGKAWSNTGATTDQLIIGGDFSSVAWSSQLGLFVAIASSGSTRIMYSYDGIIWNNTGITGYNNALVGNRIVWVDDLGHFVAIYENTNTGIGYSQNGFNWTYTGTAGGFPNGTARDIVYTRELGQFVAVFRDPPSAAPITKNRIVHTEYRFMQPTSRNVFNNALVRVEDNGQYNYKYGIDTSNVGNILDFYNPYGSGQNLFPVNSLDTTTFPLSTNSVKYAGGVLAPNGKIYIVGQSEANILVIDPITNTSRTIPFAGSVGNNYISGSLAPNGKIYFAPNNASNSLILDPISESIEYLPITTTRNNKFRGSILSPTGNIYFIPNETNTILKINPNTNIITNISTTGFDDTAAKFQSCALGNDGNIYTMAAGTTAANKQKILRINTLNDSLSIINVTIPGNPDGSHTTAATAPNGNIYFGPFNSSDTVCLPPPYTTPITIQIPGQALNRSLTLGTVCGLDGNIYFVPHGSSMNYVVSINPNTNTVTQTNTISGLSGNDKYRGGVLCPDGRILFIGSAASNIGIFKTGIPTQQNPWMLGPSFNKY